MKNRLLCSFLPKGMLPLFALILLSAGCGTLSGGHDAAQTDGVPMPPSAPANISATTANQKITVSWDSIEGATSYNIYYGTASGVTKENSTKVSLVISPYTLTDLTNGLPYYLVLTAENSDGESDISSEISATPAATWERLGEGTNICDSGGNLSAAAMSESGNLYVVCGYGGFEDHQWLDVRQWDSNTSSWGQMGERIERTDVELPLWVNYGLINLVVEDEIPWISWEENLLLLNEAGGAGLYYKVAYWDGTSWVQKGDAIESNNTGIFYNEMKLAVHGSTPYLATDQNPTANDGDIYVHYWDGSQWSTLGDKLDPGYGHSPQIVFDGDTPYVAWMEFNTTSVSNSILMKYWDGSQWIQLGDGIIPSDGWWGYYSLTPHNGIPYVAWIEMGSADAHVSAWNATNGVWMTDAYTIVQGAYPSPAFYLQFIGSTPYLVGYNSSYYIFAQYWDGSSWKEVNSDIGTNRAMEGVAAVSNGQSLCIFWVSSTDSDNIDNYAGCVP